LLSPVGISARKIESKVDNELESGMQHFSYFAKCPPTLMFKFFGPFGNIIFNYCIEERSMTGITNKVGLNVYFCF
jgi:hypothetical protein